MLEGAVAVAVVAVVAGMEEVVVAVVVGEPKSGRRHRHRLHHMR